MITQAQLLERLRQVVDIPEGTVLQRTYRHSRTRIGSWSWWTVYPEGDEKRPQIGSHWSMTELLASDWLVVSRTSCGDWTVDPLTEPWHSRHAHELLAIT